MKIYNSLSGKKEDLEIPKNRPLRLFVCGPTVYDSPHIGHARTYIAFDVLARFLRSGDTRLTYLQNITNIDDKIITRAREKHTDPYALGKIYEVEYKTMMQAIGIVSVDTYARATEYIPEIIEQIQALIEKGYAYEITGDGWYFNIAKFKDYGKLSGRTAADAEDSLSRIDESVKKINKGDFCLWKFVETAQKSKKGIENGEPFWKAALGTGRPGWHIEDTAITESFFGPQYDMHGGSMDLKFPHHEAEIAQQEAASGKIPFVKYWLHTGFLLAENRKMSKSLKNFITIAEFLGADKALWPKRATILRLAVLAVHYRSPINFTKETESQAIGVYENLSFVLDALEFTRKKSKNKTSPLDVVELVKTMGIAFTAGMEDDLNVPEALAGIFEALQKVRPVLFTLSKTEAKTLKSALEHLLAVLGIAIPVPAVPGKIWRLARERDLCRGSKQFTQSDVLRKRINALGYEVNDTPLGSFVRKS